MNPTSRDPGPSTRCRGARLLALRLGWGLVVLVTLELAVAAFVEVFGRASLDQMFRVGSVSLEGAIVRGLEDAGLSRNVLIQSDIAFRSLGFLVFFATGSFLFLRRSDDWMTALSSLMLITVGASWFAPARALDGTIAETSAKLIGATEPWTPEFGRSLAGVFLLLFTLLFPDGRFVPRWSRWVVLALGIHLAFWVALPGSPFDVTTWPDLAAALWVLSLILLSLSAQTFRLFFVASPREKQQTQHVVGALAAIAAAPALLFVVNPELGRGIPGLALRTPQLEAVYSVIVLAILAVALMLLPLSIAFSILRYRLWDFDIIINRTIVYASVTAILGAGYVIVVAAVSSFIGRSYVTVATATLLVAVLFQPLRRRLQDEIDRRFYRSKYDAARTVEAFSARLRQEIDPESLVDEVLRAAKQAMHPRRISLWVVHEPDSFEMSIYPRSADGEAQRVEVDPDDVAIGVFRANPGARPLEEAIIDSVLLTRLRAQGVDVIVPLVSQGEFIGFMNLGPRLSGRPYTGDDLRLLDILADHAAPAVRLAVLVRSHESELRQRERFENEMRVAQLIQRQFLPKQLPDLPGWQIDATYRAARSVGGDFYDFIDLPDGRVAVVIGDVTGKGVPAALVMATTRSIIRTDAPRLIEPGLVLASVNEQLIPDTPSSMFVTCLYAVLEPGTGFMTFANAGHNLPYVRSVSSVTELWARGMPLGLLPGMTYEEADVRVEPGDTLLLHSDGMVEAHDAERRMFGGERMKAAIARHSEDGSLIDSMLESLAEFTGGGWEQEDDITLVSLHRSGVGARSSPPEAGADGGGHVGRPATTDLVHSTPPSSSPGADLPRGRGH